MSRTLHIDVYSDIVCPWCYIGERRLTRALASFPHRDQVEVVFRPYQLDPQAPEDAVPLTQYLARRFGPRAEGMLDQVSAAARGEGISIDWHKALSANTRTAHRLLTFAGRQHGAAVQRDLVERLFELHFTRGGNVADIAQLVETAVAAGLDPERARSYLESGEGLPELEADLEEARRLGIRAVPTFLIDGHAVIQGAQPSATFLAALEQASRTPPGRT